LQLTALVAVINAMPTPSPMTKAEVAGTFILEIGTALVVFAAVV